MNAISGRPDITQLEIPVDAWTLPFWNAASEHRLMLPSCRACGQFRWPPGPFCPACHSQDIAWADPGIGFIFSYTVILGKPLEDGAWSPTIVPSLITFPDAGGIRLIAALVDSQINDVRIGAMVSPVWVKAMEAIVPMFRLA